MENAALQGSSDGVCGGISVHALFVGRLAGRWLRGADGGWSFTSSMTSCAASCFTSIFTTDTASYLTSSFTITCTAGVQKLTLAEEARHEVADLEDDDNAALVVVGAEEALGSAKSRGAGTWRPTRRAAVTS
jgi:hypothetical protein